MCPFSISNPRPKKGKKAFSCEAAADLPSSDKVSFLNQDADELLQEIEEHGHKPGTSEKQSDLLTRSEFREKDVSFIEKSKHIKQQLRV